MNWSLILLSYCVNWDKLLLDVINVLHGLHIDDHSCVLIGGHVTNSKPIKKEEKRKAMWEACDGDLVHLHLTCFFFFLREKNHILAIKYASNQFSEIKFQYAKVGFYFILILNNNIINLNYSIHTHPNRPCPTHRHPPAIDIHRPPHRCRLLQQWIDCRSVTTEFIDKWD